MGMSKVKLAIEVATGASYSVKVSSETIEAKDELAREIIDVLRRHFPMSGTSMIYYKARLRSPYDDVHRSGSCASARRRQAERGTTGGARYADRAGDRPAQRIEMKPPGVSRAA
jgi:hypothetical protein